MFRSRVQVLLALVCTQSKALSLSLTIHIYIGEINIYKQTDLHNKYIKKVCIYIYEGKTVKTLL